MAAASALKGKHVAVVDTDINSPGIHVLFGMDQDETQYTLNDFLWGKCSIKDTAHDVTGSLKGDLQGKIYMIPSSMNAGEITRVIREGYDVGLLNDGFQDLIDDLDLDVLMIDTHPGLNEETVLSIAISDVLLLIMRPDQQDFLGTSVTVEVARKLGVPKMYLLLNKVPESLDQDDLRKQAERLYSSHVAAMVPHSDKMMVLGSKSIFSLEFPDDPLTEIYADLAALVVD
jgi:MinD-like ATPase involved in chromosome partitioning or flagellar assembly